MKQFLKARVPLLVFLIGYVIFSFLTFRSYGITWDEPRDYGRGDDFIEHSLGRSEIDIASQSRYQGYLLYNSSYMAFNSFTSKYIFQSEDFAYRHLVNLLFASILFISIYELLLLASGSAILSGFAPLLLFLTPSFTGHIPGNPKDIPFAVLFLLGLYVIVVASKIQMSSLRVLLVGIVFGLAIAQRLLGLQLFLIYFGYQLYTAYKVSNRKITFREILSTMFETSNIAVVSLFVILVTWPYVAANPLQHGKDVLLASSHYPWTGTLLSQGTFFQAPEIPLSYLPAGFSVQLPLFLLILLGVFLIYLKRLWTHDLVKIAVVTIILNIVLYLGIKPVVYDTIRHYLFLIPVFVILSVLALQELWKTVVNQSQKNRKVYREVIGIATLGAIILSILLTGNQFIRLHPYQYVYYNELVGYVQGATGRYETEYWLASYKEAAEWLQEHIQTTDSGQKVKLYVSGSSYSAYAYVTVDTIIPTKSIGDADYLILSTRSGMQRASEDFELLHEVGRNGATFTEVYRRK